MPALITHYLFGQEALKSLDPRLGKDEALRKSFLLGCQGADPFFYAVRGMKADRMHRLGRAMHRTRVTATLEHLRQDVALLPESARLLGEAFVTGFLAHYALDRNAHPYVYSMEFALCDENAGLADAYHEVHALIESEIDSGMLDLMCGKDTLELPPADVLDAPAEAVLAAGTLLAQNAQSVHGIDVRPSDYATAVEDMRFLYRSIEPYGRPLSRAVAIVERTVRPHSLMRALSHKPEVGYRDNPSMNSERLTWKNPFQETSSCESFPQVFDRSLADFHQLQARYAAGEPMAAAVGGIDFNGKPMDEREGCLGSVHPI